LTTNGKGFTLIEVLLGTLLMSFVIGLFFTFFRQTSQIFSKQTEEVTAQQSFIIVCQTIERECIGVTSFDITHPGNRTFTLTLRKATGDPASESVFTADQGKVTCKTPSAPMREFRFYERKPEEVQELSFAVLPGEEANLIRFSAVVQASPSLALQRIFNVRRRLTSGRSYFPKVELD
jgi:type II secretory pathway pseudopilin PulG